MVFTEEQIRNVFPNGESKVKITTKRDYSKVRLDIPYAARNFDEILRSTATAINLNYTSLEVAGRLIAAIPESFWDDPDIYKRRILDPFGDSGFLEKALVKKLMDNEHMIARFPDYGMRAYHILHNMIFAVAKTHTSSLWLRKIVYYSADATVDDVDRGWECCPAIFSGRLFRMGYDKAKLQSYQMCGNIKSPYVEGVIGTNDIFDYPALDWLDRHNGDSRSFIEYLAIVFWDVFCDKAYLDCDEEERKAIMEQTMKKLVGYFDVIIGNPPYNTNDPETGAIGKTIYDAFCDAAHSLNPKVESFIIPSRFLYGKANVKDSFPQRLMQNKDHSLSYMELIDGKEAFPTVNTGEILIYCLDSEHNDARFTFVDHGPKHDGETMDELTYAAKSKRWMFVRDSVIDKIAAKGLGSLADHSKPLQYDCGIVYDKFGNDLIHDGVGFKYTDQPVIYPDGKTIGPRKTLEYSLVKTDRFSTKYYMVAKTKLYKTDENGKREHPVTNGCDMVGHIFIEPSLISDWKNNKFDHDVVCTPAFCNYGSKTLDYPYHAVKVHPGEVAGGRMRAIGYDADADNVLKYLQTKFVTYILTSQWKSQAFKAETLRFVPYMDFSQEWTDEKLYEYFGLDADEISRIEDCWKSFRANASAVEPIDEEDEEDEQYD